MFGLKIVKSQDYNDLKWRLNQALAIIDEKEAKIAELNDTIREKDVELSKRPTFLTDVAETPLVKEVKSEKKPRKVVKKTGEAEPRRKVVRKTNEQ